MAALPDTYMTPQSEMEVVGRRGASSLESATIATAIQPTNKISFTES